MFFFCIHLYDVVVGHVVSLKRNCPLETKHDANFDRLVFFPVARMLTAPVVVRLQRTVNKIVQGCDVYIGHAWQRGGWNFSNSKWCCNFANPTHSCNYENHIRQSGLVDGLNELTDKVLGCWCPTANVCHGSVLVKLWKERFPEHVDDPDLYKRHFEKDEVVETLKVVRPKRKVAVLELPDKQKGKQKRMKDQETAPSGVKSIAWPVIDHPWNAYTIWIDEAGMGCYAGPLHVAGTILLPGFNVLGIHDSKLLNPAERECVFRKLKESPHILYHVEEIDNQEIDRLHLGQAWREGIRRTILNLKAQAEQRGLVISKVVLDGNKTVEDTAIEVTPVVKADRLFAGVGAASILAKVSRDTYMAQVAEKYPEFAEIFTQRHGYHSDGHKRLLEEGKYTELHRKSFDPLKSILRKKIVVVVEKHPKVLT